MCSPILWRTDEGTMMFWRSKNSCIVLIILSLDGRVLIQENPFPSSNQYPISVSEESTMLLSFSSVASVFVGKRYAQIPGSRPVSHVQKTRASDARTPSIGACPSPVGKVSCL